VGRLNGTRPGLVIVDSSVRKREDEPAVKATLDEIGRSHTATCSVVTMELLFSARDVREFTKVELEESSTRSIPLTRSVERAARCAYRELLRGSDGRHRVPVQDVLIAAAAQEAGASVLHYDHHFDRLEEVMRFGSVWVAPAGSLS
jgi:predicted nucleic acid-binding protein